MAYIKIKLDAALMDGHNVTFKAPCDCTAVEGLKVCYIENNSLQEKIFSMKDTHGNTLAGLGNLFAEGAYIHAILDSVNLIAYLQNAATNGYLEGKLKAAEAAIAADHAAIEDLVNNQIPEEYLQACIDDYISNNQSGLASKTDLENLNSVLSSEIESINDNLSSEIADLSTELFPYHILDGWVNKQIGGSNGTFGTNTTRMSIYEYLSKDIKKVGVAKNSNLVFVIYGWDSKGNYIGGWINGEWKTSGFSWYNYIDLNDIYKLYPDYQLKISAKYAETADIDVSEGEKVLFYTSNIENLNANVSTIAETMQKTINTDWVNGIRQCAWRGCMNVVDNDAIIPYAPENSFPAFRKCIDEKMDYMWLAGIAYTDPESEDCDLYIMHDANLLRTTGVDGEIRNMTSAEIDAIPLLTRGTTKWSSYDLRIPRFEDCIKLAIRNKQKMGLRIGIPAPNNTANRQMLWNKFFAYCDKYNLLDAIYSGNIEQARVVNAHNPMLHVQTTGSSSDTVDDVLTALELLHTEGFKNCSHIVYYNALASDGEIIMSKAREYGIKIFAVNLESTNEAYLETYEEYKRLYTDLCVDGIITHHKIDMNF